MSLISSVENLPKQQSLDGVENDVFQMPINNNESNNVTTQITLQHAPEIQNNNPSTVAAADQIRETTETGNHRNQPENPVLSFNVEITPPQQCSSAMVMPPDGATCLPDVVPKINQRLLKHR